MQSSCMALILHLFLLFISNSCKYKKEQWLSDFNLPNFKLINRNPVISQCHSIWAISFVNDLLFSSVMVRQTKRQTYKQRDIVAIPLYIFSLKCVDGDGVVVGL